MTKKFNAESSQPFACNHPISAPGRSERSGEWHPLQWFEPIPRKQQCWWQLKFLLCGLHATRGNRFVYKSEGLGWQHREEHEGNNPVWSAKGQKKAELEGQPRQEEFAFIHPSLVSGAVSFLKTLSKGALGTANAFKFSYWCKNLRDMNSYHQSWFCGRASGLFGYTSSRVFLCQSLVAANEAKVLPSRV